MHSKQYYNQNIISCIGMGLICSIGNNRLEFESSLENQISGFTTDFNNRFIGFINGGHNKYLIDTVRMALNEAINDSGLDKAWIRNNSRVGMVLGTSLGNIGFWEEMLRTGHLVSNRKFLTGYLFELLKKSLRISGPSYLISNTCVTGINAISIAVSLLKSMEIDVCIVGGMDFISDFVYSGMKSLKTLTKKDSIHFFGSERDGMVLGEAVGFIVLTRERCNKKYGSIAGYSITNDAVHLTAPDREGRGLIRAIKESLAMAEILSEQIDCILCGSTGTLYNDAMQAKAIHALYNSSGKHIPITSIKHLTGHTLGASGIIETIGALIMMYKKCIYPISNNYNLDPELTPLFLIREYVKKDLKNILLLASGFSGVNGALVVQG